jgi:hypothetical protein
MSNDVALFKQAGISLAAIGKYQQALAKVQASAPVIGGTPILRLDKEGVWRYGQQLIDVEEGSLWAANPLSFGKGYTAWQKGINKPRGSVMKNILSGELVDIGMLPDVTPAEWSESVEVEFQCLNGQDKGITVKYTANNMGGVERWHELVAQLSHQFAVNPNKLVAVVSLEHDGYFHSNTQYGTRHPQTKAPGWIVKPVFKVVDWMAMDGKADEPQEEVEEAQERVNERIEAGTQPAGRRASTITDNGAAPETQQPTRRQSTIALDAPASKLTGMPSEPGPDPVVRRRRRVAS